MVRDGNRLLVAVLRMAADYQDTIDDLLRTVAELEAAHASRQSETVHFCDMPTPQQEEAA